MSNTGFHKWSVLFAVTATQFAAPFMISAVGVILPSIGMEFQANGMALSLVESVFLGVSAMCLLIFGRASDLMGRGWLFVTGLSIFTAATIALGFVNSIEALIAVRGVQAFGGSMQVSTGLAILLEAFPTEERGKALGISLAGVYMGLSAGPFLGGIIAGIWGWRWVFFLGSPLCILALILSAKVMDLKITKPKEPFDIIGSLLSMGWICLFLYSGARMHTASGLWAFGATIALLVLFLVVEIKSKNPLLDISMFRGNSTFSCGNLFQFINYSATFGITFLMSLYLQFGHGMSPTQAGHILVIQPLVQGLLTPLFGRMADSYPSGPMVSTGMFIGVAGLGWASVFDAQTSMLSIIAMLTIMGVGTAFFVSPNMNLIMSSVSPHQYGIATAVTGQMRIVGMTTCMVIISMVISFVVGDVVLSPDVFPAFNRTMHLTLRGFCVVALVGAVMSLVMGNKMTAAKES